MQECKGIFGRLFGHNYQARMDEGQPTLYLESFKGSGDTYLELVRASRPTTYRGDVCKRCGDIRNAPLS